MCSGSATAELQVPSWVALRRCVGSGLCDSPFQKRKCHWPEVCVCVCVCVKDGGLAIYGPAPSSRGSLMEAQCFFCFFKYGSLICSVAFCSGLIFVTFHACSCVLFSIRYVSAALQNTQFAFSPLL